MTLLTAEQRDLFYLEAMREVESAAGDLEMIARGARQGRRPCTSLSRLRSRLSSAAEILDDLGWQPDDNRTTYRITIEPSRWLEWVEEIAGDTAHALDDNTAAFDDPNRWRHYPIEDHEEADDEIRATVHYDGRVMRACAAVLAEAA